MGSGQRTAMSDRGMLGQEPSNGVIQSLLGVRAWDISQFYGLQSHFLQNETAMPEELGDSSALDLLGVSVSGLRHQLGARPSPFL